MPELDHPTAPEQRTIDVDVQDVDTRGRTVVGYAAVYDARSADLGGFDETIAPGAFAEVLRAQPDVRGLLNHDPNQVLGRTRSGTLRLFDEARGLRFELDLPNSPLGENVREAISRRDVDGASFRFRVGRDSWEGRTRTIETVAELQDVTIATVPAYAATSVELRTRPTEPAAPAPVPEQEEAPVADTQTGGLTLEDRAATIDTPTVETRIIGAIRSVEIGEKRTLTTTSAEPIAPPELSSYLWDKLRPLSIGLASGIRVIPTDREKIVWPRLVADVDPTWVAETDRIPAGDPGFSTLEAEPRKLAHRVELSNEVIDDSEPSILDVLRSHLATMLALKLDRSLFEGNPSADPQSVRGLKFTAGIQSLSMGTNGAPLEDYDPFVQAVGLLRAANVAGPYVIATHPTVLTGLELLKEAAASNVQLGAPAGLPPFFTSSQFSTAESKGTATNARSAYVYAPGEIVLVRRKDAEVALDRSRLFDFDMSELRALLRADLIVPNPTAVVRIDGIVPAA